MKVIKITKEWLREEGGSYIPATYCRFDKLVDIADNFDWLLHHIAGTSALSECFNKWDTLAKEELINLFWKGYKRYLEK